jgi:Phosphoribosyl-AMP cyclohydrolase
MTCSIEDVKFDSQGLVPAIAQDAENGQILMMAWMNKLSLERTLLEGRAVYWSRSRQEFWRKGDSSGHIQEVLSLSLDCDGDTILMHVKQTGAACHTGARSCFFRELSA